MSTTTFTPPESRVVLHRMVAEGAMEVVVTAAGVAVTAAEEAAPVAVASH